MKFQIAEQTVVDKVSRLTLRFWVDADGFSRISIFSAEIPFMNRDLGFEKEGEGIAFSGTGIWDN